MKIPLKKLLIPTITAITVLFSLLTGSCNRDKCKTVVCAYNGVCNGGACICQSGYEGSNCETITRNKYLGNWTVFEKGSTSTAAQYQLSIIAADDITKVAIVNFNNYFTHLIMATVVGDSIYIPNQQFNGKVTFGVGYIYSNVTYGQFGSMSVSYEVIDTATLRVDDYGYYAEDLSDPSSWNK